MSCLTLYYPLYVSFVFVSFPKRPHTGSTEIIKLKKITSRRDGRLGSFRLVSKWSRSRVTSMLNRSFFTGQNTAETVFENLGVV